MRPRPIQIQRRSSGLASHEQTVAQPEQESEPHHDRETLHGHDALGMRPQLGEIDAPEQHDEQPGQDHDDHTDDDAGQHAHTIPHGRRFAADRGGLVFRAAPGL